MKNTYLLVHNFNDDIINLKEERFTSANNLMSRVKSLNLKHFEICIKRENFDGYRVTGYEWTTLIDVENGKKVYECDYIKVPKVFTNIK